MFLKTAIIGVGALNFACASLTNPYNAATDVVIQARVGKNKTMYHVNMAPYNINQIFAMIRHACEIFPLLKKQLEPVMAQVDSEMKLLYQKTMESPAEYNYLRHVTDSVDHSDDDYHLDNNTILEDTYGYTTPRNEPVQPTLGIPPPQKMAKIDIKQFQANTKAHESCRARGKFRCTWLSWKCSWLTEKNTCSVKAA